MHENRCSRKIKEKPENSTEWLLSDDQCRHRVESLRSLLTPRSSSLRGPMRAKDALSTVGILTIEDGVDPLEDTVFDRALCCVRVALYCSQ